MLWHGITFSSIFCEGNPPVAVVLNLQKISNANPRWLLCCLPEHFFITLISSALIRPFSCPWTYHTWICIVYRCFSFASSLFSYELLVPHTIYKPIFFRVAPIVLHLSSNIWINLVTIIPSLYKIMQKHKYQQWGNGYGVFLCIYLVYLIALAIVWNKIHLWQTC